MRLKVKLIGSDWAASCQLVTYLRGRGYEVALLEEPEDCPVYHGKNCSRKCSCREVLMIEQYLTTQDALDYVLELSRKCPGSIENVAVFASILSPDELVTAIELGCKVMFKPVLPQEVEKWLVELEKSSESVPELRKA